MEGEGAGFPEQREETNRYTVVIGGQEITFENSRDLSKTEAEIIARMMLEHHRQGATEKGAANDVKPVSGMGIAFQSAIKKDKFERTARGENIPNPENPNTEGEVRRELINMGVLKSAEEQAEKQAEKDPRILRQEYEKLIRTGKAKRTEEDNFRLKELEGVFRNNSQNKNPERSPKKPEGRKEGPRDANTVLKQEISVLRDLEEKSEKVKNPSKREKLLRMIAIQKGRVNGLPKNNPD